MVRHAVVDWVSALVFIALLVRKAVLLLETLLVVLLVLRRVRRHEGHCVRVNKRRPVTKSDSSNTASQ